MMVAEGSAGQRNFARPVTVARARELGVPVIDEAALRRMVEETAGVE